MIFQNIDSVLIWDSEGSPPESSGSIVLWRGFLTPESTNSVSIPAFIEENADILRSSYLAWVYELGNLRIEDCRLIDHLEIRPGFSYWWMHLLTHKANSFASPCVNDAVKMIAFEKMVPKIDFVNVILVSENRHLADAFERWCANKRLSFKWSKPPCESKSMPWLRRIHDAMPKFLQAFIEILRLIKTRLPMREIGSEEITRYSGNRTFVGYLLNLNEEAIRAGTFKTGYWTELHVHVDQEQCATNWLHKYIHHAFLPHPADAANLLTQLNNKSRENAFHAFIDSSMDVAVVLSTVRDYLKLVTRGMILRKYVDSLFKPKNSSLDLWPLFKEDWNNSIYGRYAVQNCLDLNLTEATLKLLPPQKAGFYLQENQAWEMAFIHSWKSAGHGLLVGVPHGTVRFWDLRYFYDSQTYNRLGMNNLPMPDKVALNGPAPVSIYRDAGYPQDQIVEVEALRFLYLNDFEYKEYDVVSETEESLTVLILGDYGPLETKRQLEMLQRAVAHLSQNIYWLCRPHPSCPIDPKDYPGLSLHLSSEALSVLLSRADVAYTGSRTSAAVDAWCTGVPVVTLLDGSELNMSPLRLMDGVTFVHDPEKLAEAIVESVRTSPANAELLFFLNKNLSRWKKLIGLEAEV